jgi:hypothetical protein
MAAVTTPAEKLIPVYVPWKSFSNYVGGLKLATLPHTLDNSVKPKAMSGGLWRQILSALRFLGLTENENVATDGLGALVGAHGTEQWPQAVKEHVLHAYENIIGNLPLENATAAQLDARFKENGNVDGQMLKKCVRFYIHALKESQSKYSSHFSIRDSTGSRIPRKSAKRKAQKPRIADAGDSAEDRDTVAKQRPKGMIDFTIPLGEVDGLIRVNRDINMMQMPLVLAIVSAVEALAKQNTNPIEEK